MDPFSMAFFNQGIANAQQSNSTWGRFEAFERNSLGQFLSDEMRFMQVEALKQRLGSPEHAAIEEQTPDPVLLLIEE